MANVKVRISHDFPRILKEVKKKYKADIPKKLAEAILYRILQGKSPVKGYGPFDKYSDSYKKQIRRGYYPGKQIRPVNLKLNGMMLRSLKIRNTQKGFTLFFSDEKANWHQYGEGTVPVRRMLPDEGEKFSIAIDDLMTKELTKIVEDALKK